MYVCSTNHLPLWLNETCDGKFAPVGKIIPVLQIPHVFAFPGTKLEEI